MIFPNDIKRLILKQIVIDRNKKLQQVLFRDTVRLREICNINVFYNDHYYDHYYNNHSKLNGKCIIKHSFKRWSIIEQ